MLSLINTPFLFLGVSFLLVKESTSHLRIADFLIFGAIINELLVLAPADDDTVLNDQNQVAVFYGADPLGHGDNGGLGQGGGKGLPQCRVGLVIKSA